MSPVHYRYATPSDKQAILSLLKTNTPMIPDSLRGSLFDWQFVDANPLAKDRASFWISEVDGQVAGINGMMPVDVRMAGQIARVIWSCDTLVSDRFRGLGIGKGLLSLVSNETSLVLGYGISDMSDPILAKLGWHHYPDVSTMFFYSNEAGVRGKAKNVLSMLRSAPSGLKLAHSDVSITALSERFGAGHDALWQRVENEYPYAVVRNADYLNWRYRDHPVLSYDVLEARRAGDLIALMVIRHDFYEAVIADYVGPAQDEDVMRQLVRVAKDRLTTRGVARIRCETSLVGLKQILRDAGFIDYPGTSRFRFFVGDSIEIPKSEMNWFVMTGDSDNECSQVGKIFERAAK